MRSASDDVAAKLEHGWPRNVNGSLRLPIEDRQRLGWPVLHMRHIPQSEAEPGDLVVFGASPGHHVCVVLTKGGHSLASHGEEAGPIKVGFGDEHAAQSRYGASQVTWLTAFKK